MRKATLLLSAFALALTASALRPMQSNRYPISAAQTKSSQFVVSTLTTDFQKPAKAPAKADEEVLTVDHTPAYDPYTFLGLNGVQQGYQVAQAFKLSQDEAKKFGGNNITKIFFYVGGDKSTGKNNIKSATLFITKDLDKTPDYTQEMDISGYTQGGALAYGTLDTPYAIKSNESLYIGYYLTLSSATDMVISSDYTMHYNDRGGYDDRGGYIGVRTNSSSDWQWQNLNEGGYGFSCVGATISGTNMPTDDVSIDAIYANPAFEQNTPFAFEIALTNHAANVINEVELEYTIGDSQKVTTTAKLNEGIIYNKTGYCLIENVSYPKSDTDLEIKVVVNKVNGAFNMNSDSYECNITRPIVPEGKGYQRNVVIEEFTGTWCGWCPRGIVTMEAIREKYPDGGLIPVAVHGYDNKDPMLSETYISVNSNFNTHSVYPNSILNRQYAVQSLELEEVEEVYNALKEVPAVANIEATAWYEPEGYVNVDTKTTFALDYTDADERYAISIGITEDNVGPYDQENYFSNSGVECGGWEKLGSSVPTIYNDVARVLSTYEGLKNSIPANVTAREEYSLNKRIIVKKKVDNVENLNVVVYLINKETLEIENVTTVKNKNIGTSGVEDIEIDNSNEPVEYFNLQGIRVANPENGIFIRRQGTDVTKVIL